jgi:hypothetical protein
MIPYQENAEVDLCSGPSNVGWLWWLTGIARVTFQLGEGDLDRSSA